MRKAFSMITAIFVMIIMASIAMLVFNLSGKMVKSTTVQYRTEQAALLARSYTEFAVMSVMNYDRTTNKDCIEDIDSVVNSVVPGQVPPATATSTNGAGYDVQTRIYYLGNALPCSQTRKLNDSTDASRSGTSITTNYNNISATDAIAAIIVDVYVRYKDPGTDNPANAAWITYHRRTLQKI